MTLEETIWSKIEKTPTCWLWKGSQDQGYAILTYRYRKYRIHRWMYETLKGPIAAHLVPDHLCRIRHCVNPDHLELVSRGENVLRGIGRTALNKRKTHCKRGHQRWRLQTQKNGKVKRFCKECVRVWTQEKRTTGTTPQWTRATN